MSAELDSRLQLFPVTTRVVKDGESQQLHVNGLGLRELAVQFGTPLYLYDQQTINSALSEYRTSLAENYPGESAITYAGKAFLCLAMAEYVRQNDLWLDCTGAGELRIARAAGVLYEKTVVHGVSKSRADLEAALEQAGVIVVDHPGELKQLAEMLRSNPVKIPEVWLRFRPGIAVDTHRYTQTGQNDSKFGMSAKEIEQAVVYGLECSLQMTGLHFHQGSQFHDPAPLKPAIDSVLDLIMHLRQKTGWIPEVFCAGGGWGVPYHTDDLPHRQISEYISFVAEQLAEGCRQRNLPLPRLQLEPGRSLVARAGIAVYETIAVKRTSGRHWILLDGGLADNPRPALYRARYTALPVREPERSIAGPVCIGGPFCESGDILIEDLPMPEIEPDEYLAVPVSGAYQLSMGSNYNGARRPAVVWVSNGQADLIQRRETLDDLVRRDLPLPK
jgi:diaminopimelate decarboxylase